MSINLPGCLHITTFSANKLLLAWARCSFNLHILLVDTGPVAPPSSPASPPPNKGNPKSVCGIPFHLLLKLIISLTSLLCHFLPAALKCEIYPLKLYTSAGTVLLNCYDSTLHAKGEMGFSEIGAAAHSRSASHHLATGSIIGRCVVHCRREARTEQSLCMLNWFLHRWITRSRILPIGRCVFTVL